MSDLLKVFQIAKRQELVKHCRTAVIRRDELADFVIGCRAGQLPWRYDFKRQETRPKHLALSDEDMRALAKMVKSQSMTQEAQKVFTKVGQTFKDRRLLAGHIFASDDFSQWHVFYFDQRDRSVRGNHWSEGAHIHLVNYLMRPREDAQSVWATFCSGGDLGRAEHLRYYDPTREKPDV